MSDESRGPEIPAGTDLWSRILEADQRRRLVDLVLAALTARGQRGELIAGAVRINGDDRRLLGLDNLAQVCAAAPSSEWPGHVDRHVGIMLPALDGGRGDKESLAEARDNLRVRIYPSETAGLGRGAVPLCEGLVAAVVRDFPDRVATVGDATLDAWGVGVDELFQAAIEQTRLEVVPLIETIHEAPLIQGIESDSFYAASVVLWLDQVIPAAGRHGHLVAIPSRGLVVVHTITGADVVEAVQVMAPAALHMYAQGPGSITDQLYWVRDGSMTRLPVSVSGDRIGFHPPDDFVDALNSV